MLIYFCICDGNNISGLICNEQFWFLIKHSVLSKSIGEGRSLRRQLSDKQLFSDQMGFCASFHLYFCVMVLWVLPQCLPFHGEHFWEKVITAANDKEREMKTRKTCSRLFCFFTPHFLRWIDCSTAAASSSSSSSSYFVQLIVSLKSSCTVFV